ncbi:hypothetical protein HDU87_004376 [Geranomyces variabilis]|uniref:Amino acid transporter n=1 Tax=Geranomyces variabilis TaxID=109894 RepID=A0AAD5TKW0_9FUNG|nr:hypothetical protein HDU87_004376 [Geranomyces variabilis]
MSVLSALAGPVRRVYRPLSKVNTLWWILICSAIGILCGKVAPDFSKNYLGLLSSAIFIPMIKSVIVPLVFSLLIVGIAGHGDDMARLGRLGVKSIAYFLSLTVVAIFIGLAWSAILKPGEGNNFVLPKVAQNSTAEFNLPNELSNIIPVSFFAAASANNSLQITFCGIMFACALLCLKEKKTSKKTLIGFFQAVADAMLEVVKLIMRFTPIAIGGSLSKTVAVNGLSSLATLAKLIGTTYAALASFVLLVLLPVALIARVPIIPFLKAVRDPLVIAFTTASSDAALAPALENMIELGCPTHITSFVIPVGYAFNLDGTTIYLGTAILFVAQVSGIEWPIGIKIARMFGLLLMSKGIAGVPRASIAVLTAACIQWGLPTEVIGIIIGIDEICDMARTALNLFGNCLACVVISRWEGEFRLYNEPTEEERLAAVIEDEENQKNAKDLDAVGGEMTVVHVNDEKAKI